MLFCHEFDNVVNLVFLVQIYLVKIGLRATFFAVCKYVVPLFLFKGAFCPKEIAEVIIAEAYYHILLENNRK